MGESWLHAATRELAEELALTVIAVGTPILTIEDPGSHFVITFINVHVRGEPEPLEHDEVRWVNTTQLSTIQFAPSDRKFLDWLLRHRETPQPLPPEDAR